MSLAIIQNCSTDRSSTKIDVKRIQIADTGISGKLVAPIQTRPNVTKLEMHFPPKPNVPLLTMDTPKKARGRHFYHSSSAVE